MFPLKVGVVAVVVLVLGASTAEGADPVPLLPGYPVTGRVMAQPGGKPVAGTLVTLWNGSGSGRWTARTDAKGAYSFPDVQPGDYYKVWIEERPNKEVGTWSEAVVVRVKDRPVAADDLFAQLPQSLSGTVTDADTGKPVAGAEINFSTADRNRSGVQTDANGRYRLFVTSREVDLYCTGTADRYDPPEQRHQTTVGAGKHVTGIDFKVKSAPQFTGLVVYPDGKPARAAQVTVEVRRPALPVGGIGDLDTTKAYQFTTDDEGRFVGHMLGARKLVTANIAGDFRAEARMAAPIDIRVVARPLDHSMGGIVRGKTTAKDEFRIDPLKVVLARSANVLVRVVDPDGKPLLNSEVSASNYLWRDWSGLGGAVKHVGDGRYLVMGLILGLEYHVWANTPGLRSAACKEPVTLKPDETRTLADLRLEWWGKKAVPGLVKKLQGANAFERDLALALLGELGADAVEAVPALVETLNKDPGNAARFAAATTLGKIGPSAKAAVPDLIKALKEDDGGGVQREAATALGLIGDSAAVPSLKVAATHADTDIARAAAEAIKRLDEFAKTRSTSE